MYTCDYCGVDTGSPENLIRAWYTNWGFTIAFLVCGECLDAHSSTQLLEYAEDDEEWDYGKSFNYATRTWEVSA